MKTFDWKVTIHEYENVEALSAADAELAEKSKEAAMGAYAPYSQFSVGAAVRLANGKIITGNNQENAAYPSGLCAERVAIFYANAQYPNVPVEALAVIAMNSKKEFMKIPAPPCGSCRQVLLETEQRFKTPMKIILVGSESIRIIENAKSLLPLNFDKDMLG